MRVSDFASCDKCFDRRPKYCSELKAAATQLAAQQQDWHKASEGDKHQDVARQSYRSRETDSADGFAEGLKLFNPKKPGSDEKLRRTNTHSHHRRT